MDIDPLAEPAVDVSLLMQVPVELQLEILTNLHARDLLLRVVLLNKHFCRLVRDEAALWRAVIRRHFDIENFLPPSNKKDFNWVQYYREKVTFKETAFSVRIACSPSFSYTALGH